MSVLTKKTTIGGFEYEVTQFGALQGLAFFPRVVKMLGPSIASAIDASTRGLSMRDVVDTIVRDVGPGELKELVDAFAPQTRVRLAQDRAPTLDQIFDDHFAGKYEHVFAWLKFAIEVNYAGFFGELQSAIAGAISIAAAKIKGSQSPQGSSGGSTA